MPRTLRAFNIVGALFPLASGLAVLGANLLDPTYPYQDSLGLVLGYCAFYVFVVHAFWRATPAARPLAVVKALGAYALLFTFPQFGQSWMEATPGRYVYQLFDWGPQAKIGLFAFVFLGRGAWNTINAFACTREWWFALRARRPLVGRLLTAIPVALTVACVWFFLSLVRIDAKTFSPEAHEIARLVSEGLSCEDIRAKSGTTTTDVRERGERRYEVTIQWGCADTRVFVRDPSQRLGIAGGPRSECCQTPPPPRTGGGPASG